jgi:hypothetical protein
MIWTRITAIGCAIILTTLCHAQKTDQLVVKTVKGDGDKSVTIDIGPAVYNPGTRDYDAGYHGSIIGCNTEEPTCYSPTVGERGVLTEGPQIYKGPNVTIRWKVGVTATYALHEEY